MRSHFAKMKGKKFLFRFGLCALLFLGAIAITLFTPTYRYAVRSLWSHGYYAEAYYLNHGDADLAMQIGNYYFGGGAYDLDKAQKSYERALVLEPPIQRAHYQLARIYFVEAKLPMALDEINAELAHNPLNQRSLYIRGLIDLAQNSLPAAEADFRQFTLWAPTEWGGYNDLAFTLAKEGKFAESESILKEAFKKVPDSVSNPWLWNSLGLAQLNQLDYVGAGASFAKALELAKALTPAQWVRAYSANDPSTTTSSIENFRGAIEKNLSTAKANTLSP